MRIGHGYDAHRLKPGRDCILCGVKIPYELGPDGHSDADLPAHALMDALLGAAALGDIGRLFPDSDEKYRDADSMALLSDVSSRLTIKGLTVSNADVTIVAERPKIAPYVQQMRENLAKAMDVPVDRVSVKATTEEHMGFTGDGTGIAAHAVVLLNELQSE